MSDDRKDVESSPLAGAASKHLRGCPCGDTGDLEDECSLSCGLCECKRTESELAKDSLYAAAQKYRNTYLATEEEAERAYRELLDVIESKPAAIPELAAPLLPCPFCGKSDLKIISMLAEDSPYARVVFCAICHCHGRHSCPIGWTESDKAAIEAWNDRPEPAAIPEPPVIYIPAVPDTMDTMEAAGEAPERGDLNLHGELLPDGFRFTKADEVRLDAGDFYSHRGEIVLPPADVTEIDRFMAWRWYGYFMSPMREEFLRALAWRISRERQWLAEKLAAIPEPVKGEADLDSAKSKLLTMSHDVGCEFFPVTTDEGYEGLNYRIVGKHLPRLRITFASENQAWLETAKYLSPEGATEKRGREDSRTYSHALSEVNNYARVLGLKIPEPGDDSVHYRVECLVNAALAAKETKLISLREEIRSLREPAIKKPQTNSTNQELATPKEEREK